MHFVLLPNKNVHRRISGGDPPNGRDPMGFYAQNAEFPLFSLAINFKAIFKKKMAKTCLK